MSDWASNMERKINTYHNAFKARYGPKQISVKKRVKRQIKSSISRNLETKFFDTNLANNALAVAGAVFQHSNMAQGDDQSTRTGIKISPIGLDCRCDLFMTTNPAANAFLPEVRVIFFQDLEAIGAAPAVTDVLASADPDQHIKWVNKSRFHILSDKTYDFRSSFCGLIDSTPHQAFPLRHFRTVIPKRKFHKTIRYLDGTGNPTDNGAGCVYSLWITNSVQWTPNCTFRVRLTYKDG